MKKESNSKDPKGKRPSKKHISKKKEKLSDQDLILLETMKRIECEQSIIDQIQNPAPPRVSIPDGSDAMTRAAAEEPEYPLLEIYAGHNGFFKLNERGNIKQVPISERRYPLPLDTDITEINAYGIVNKGDWSFVEQIGDMSITASRISLRECWSLKTLPHIPLAEVLSLTNCPDLKTIHPQTHVFRAYFVNCGIVFLPKSMAGSQIVIKECDNLKYIHPAIPDKNISLSNQVIQEFKLNYILSDSATEEEKCFFRSRAETASLSDLSIEMLPAYLSGVFLTVQNCSNIKYIHPSLNPEQISGLTPEKIYTCQMQYLFEKEKKESEFQKWFPIVRARGGRDRTS